MSHLHQSTHGLYQVLTIEQIARAYQEVTTHHILIDTVVTTDDNLVDSGLLSFHDAHFQVDGVTFNVHFHRVEGVEQVTVVIVQVTDGIIIAHQTFIEQFLIIYVTTLHMEQAFELGRRINGVTHPSDVTQIIFLTFIYMHEDIYRTFIKRGNAVFHNHGITVTQLIVLVDNQLLVSLVILIRELFGTEDIDQLVLLIGLLHHTLQLLGTDGFIAFESNLVDFDLIFLVDVHLYDDLIFLCRIIYLHHFHLRVLETLFIVITLDDGGGTVDGIWSYLSTLDHADAGLKFIAFRLLRTYDSDF